MLAIIAILIFLGSTMLYMVYFTSKQLIFYSQYYAVPLVSIFLFVSFIFVYVQLSQLLANDDERRHFLTRIFWLFVMIS
jgi:hypothetical protein